MKQPEENLKQLVLKHVNYALNAKDVNEAMNHLTIANKAEDILQNVNLYRPELWETNNLNNENKTTKNKDN